MTEQVPNGYKKNQLGHMVPIETIPPYDMVKDELVNTIVMRAQEVQQFIAHFKSLYMGELSAFMEIAGDKYGVKVGGKKGNCTLTSYDHQYKVQLTNAERLVFDERIQIAKQLVDECIHTWAEGARPELKALVEHAFQTDKEGKINLGRVMTLMKLDIDDSRWKKAMEAIKDSLQVSSTKSYLRIYKRKGNTDQYEQISLDMAAL